MFNIDLSRYRIVDLSYLVEPNAGGDRPFVVRRGRLADNAFKYDVLDTHTHVGTHVESPAHFFEDGKDIADLPLDAFFGRALLLEIDDAQAQHAITDAVAEADLAKLIEPGDIILCRNNDAASIAAGDPQALPHLTPSAAQWMGEHRIKMLGIDNYVRLGKDIADGRELHDILMSDDVCFVEWLDGLAKLKQKVFYFMCLPFRANTIDSSWARAIAIEEI